MDLSKVIDLVSYVNDGKPVDFSAAVHDIIGQRALEALSHYKQEIAQSMFGSQPDEDIDSYSDSDIEQAIDEYDNDIEQEQPLGDYDDNTEDN